tara:strand:+ start:459 stop:635 length:177 start_codon:yes stop_codon:yes gene_type:complete
VGDVEEGVGVGLEERVGEAERRVARAEQRVVDEREHAATTGVAADVPPMTVDEPSWMM